MSNINWSCVQLAHRSTPKCFSFFSLQPFQLAGVYHFEYNLEVKFFHIVVFVFLLPIIQKEERRVDISNLLYFYFLDPKMNLKKCFPSRIPRLFDDSKLSIPCKYCQNYCFILNIPGDFLNLNICYMILYYASALLLLPKHKSLSGSVYFIRI